MSNRGGLGNERGKPTRRRQRCCWGERQKGLNLLSLGGLGTPLEKIFERLGAFSRNLGIPQPYFQAY